VIIAFAGDNSEAAPEDVCARCGVVWQQRPPRKGGGVADEATPSRLAETRSHMTSCRREASYGGDRADGGGRSCHVGIRKGTASARKRGPANGLFLCGPSYSRARRFSKTNALFSWQKFWILGTVTLSFVYDKYCPIID